MKKPKFSAIHIIVLLLFKAMLTEAQTFPQGEYIIGNVSSLQVLDVKNGKTTVKNPIWLYQENLSDAQYFKFEQIGTPSDSIFRIQSTLSDKYLTVKYELLNSIDGKPSVHNYYFTQDTKYSMTGSPTQILNTTNVINKNQHWKLVKLSSNSNIFLIKSVRYPSKVLEAPQVGRSLKLATPSGLESQKWVLKAIPRRPTHVVVSDFKWDYTTKKISGKIKWQDNSNNEKGFTILIKRNGGNASQVLAEEVPENTTEFQFTFNINDSELGKNKEHCFSILAYTNQYKSYSEKSCKVPTSTTPSPPAKISIYAKGGCSINIPFGCAGSTNFQLSPIILTGDTGISTTIEGTIGNPLLESFGIGTKQCCVSSYIYWGEGLKTGKWKLNTGVMQYEVNLQSGLNTIRICLGGPEYNNNSFSYPCPD